MKRSAWIMEFLATHKMRYCCHDWPEQGTPDNKEFVRMWLVAFDRHGVDHQEANTASIELGATPPQFRTQHLPAVIAKVLELRQAGGNHIAPGSREQAEAESRGCEHCEGTTGMVPGYHPLYAGSAVLDRPIVDRPTQAVRQFACVCPLGIWQNDHRTPENRLPSLQIILDKKSRWLQKDPTPEGELYIPSRNKKPAEESGRQSSPSTGRRHQAALVQAHDSMDDPAVISRPDYTPVAEAGQVS